MRVTPLRGSGAALLKCPACRLTCRPTAVGADGACPDCGNRLLRVDTVRGKCAAARPDRPDGRLAAEDGAPAEG